MFNVNFPNFFIKPPKLEKKSGVREVVLQQNVFAANKLEKWEGGEENSLKKQPKWDIKKFPLSYYTQDEPSKDFNKAVRTSIKTWSEASDGLMNFQRTFSANDADIVIDWTDEKLASRDFEAGRNDLKVVNNRIEKAFVTIIINPKIDEGLSAKARIERVRRTALHEIGHAMGLNHSNNSQDVMFHRGISNKNLSASDIKRLIEHYSNKNLDIMT